MIKWILDAYIAIMTISKLGIKLKLMDCGIMSMLVKAYKTKDLVIGILI